MKRTVAADLFRLAAKINSIEEKLTYVLISIYFVLPLLVLLL